MAYIATNAPHGPMHSPEDSSAPYENVGDVGLQNFYGMIANIDDNVGSMRRFLDDEGLTENTIFIFTTDNGSSSGWRTFNSGMRAGKGSAYDGGHRVPFFIHWPNGKLTGGRDVLPITAHVDVVPTLIDLCGIDGPADVKFDGTSLSALLNEYQDTDWPDRILITDSQRVKDPIKWKSSSVMTSDWRLINGKELYRIKQDPGQESDVASGHPDVVERLRDFYEDWWAELLPTFDNDTAIYLGHPQDNPARLTSHDWITTKTTPWNQRHIRVGMTGAGNNGFWNVKIVESGRYQVSLRRWPKEIDHPIDASLPPGADVPGVEAMRTAAGKAIAVRRATLKIGDQEVSADVAAGAKEAVFTVDLKQSKTRMSARFFTAEGDEYGAYFAYVKKL